MHPIDLLRTLLHQRLAIAHQVAQVADGLGRNEAGTQQPMAQQVSEPFTVAYIGFSTRHRLHVLRVDQDHLTAAFQQVEHRSPIHSRTFHAHMRHPLASQPVDERLQAQGGGGKRAHLAAHLARGSAEQHTGHHRLLVHVQSCTAGIQDTQTHCRCPFLSAILAVDEKRAGREARKKLQVSYSYSRACPW
ncbi:MAG TPA: hypothetical protein VIY29_23665 [Ktedonobacteraceae bacterium]